MKVPFVDLPSQHTHISAEIHKALDKVLKHGMFVLGQELEYFESQFAQYCETKHAIGVGNGTDALVLSLQALDVGAGDEVITAPNSFLASASSIAMAGATPVFADVGDDYNLDPQRVEEAITPRTKAIIAVHLTGRPAQMNELSDIAKRHSLSLIEDAAQAIGAIYDGNKVGSLADVATFSFHPLKTLAVIGDGGAITTSRDDVHTWLMKARNHGLKNRDEAEFWSQNSRLDTFQAAVLSIKLNDLDRVVARRREIAQMYSAALGEFIRVPVERANEKPAYHTFVSRSDRRDDLRDFLAERGVDSKIHYPVPIHLQPAFGGTRSTFPQAELQAQEIISLPVYDTLSNAQVDHVIESVRAFHSS